MHKDTLSAKMPLSEVYLHDYKALSGGGEECCLTRELDNCKLDTKETDSVKYSKFMAT